MSVKEATIAPPLPLQEGASSLLRTRVTRRGLVKGAALLTLVPAGAALNDSAKAQEQIDAIRRDPASHTSPSVEDGAYERIGELQQRRDRDHKLLAIGIPGAVVVVYETAKRKLANRATPSSKEA